MLRRGLLPPINELVTFESAARHGSFTRAAEELALTQGAVSRLVRMLEERLGLTLFERVRQRVVLADAGKSYLAAIRPLLHKLGEETQRAMSSAGGDAVLNIATLPTFGAQWLVPRLADFHARHPGIVVNVATRVQPFDFAVETFDAAIHVGLPTWANTRAYKLMDEEIVPVCGPAYRDKLRLQAPRDLVRAKLLHQSTRPTAWVDWFSAQNIAAPTPYSGPRFEQFALVARAAAAGLGVGLVPLFLVEEQLASGQLVTLSKKSLRSAGAYWVVAPEARDGLRNVRLFVDWIVRQAKGKR